MQDLGVLVGGLESQAWGINNAGHVVGVANLADGSFHAFLWSKGSMEEAIPYLEANPHVFRYAWFSAGPIPNARLMSAAITFQVARDAISSRLSQANCCGPRKWADGP